MDTDSFIIHIKTEDVYEDITDDHFDHAIDHFLIFVIRRVFVYVELSS